MVWEPDYLSLEELKVYLDIPVDDELDDDDLQDDLTTASRIVDDHCSGAVRRQFGNTGTAQARTYDLYWTRRGWAAEIDDLQDLTGLAVEADGTVLAVDQYLLLLRNAAAEGKPYTRILISRPACTVKITAIWGWTTVPAAVKMSTKLQAGRLFKRRRAPFGIAGSPDLGGGSDPVRLLARDDADLHVSLRGLVRTGGTG